jgi:hypothetical protein
VSNLDSDSGFELFKKKERKEEGTDGRTDRQRDRQMDGPNLN